MAEGELQAAEKPPSLWTKLAYGFGSVAYGAEDNGFSFFLLLFYSQVIGVDAGLVGLALALALLLDAFVNPVIGYWSDNFRSPWGRRHPFMYAAAIPAAVGYSFIWAPPVGLSHQALFWYLLALACGVRTLVTVYETPSSALAAELTQDYDERSKLISWRYFFAWTGGNSLSAAMFLFIIPAFTVGALSGQFNRAAYGVYGIAGAIFIFLGIMISALGTHSRIRHLQPPPPQRSLSLGQVFREIFETIADRSFVALIVATLFAGVAAGLSAALSFYISAYFWGFSPTQQALLILGVFISAIIGPAIAPPITRAMGKKQGAMLIGMIAFIGSPTPMVLKLFGLMPADPQLTFWIVFVTGIIDVALIITFQVLFTAMIADLVEQAELKTGRRSEGVFFAAVTFTRKSVQGLGVLAASAVLALARFPKGVAPADVPDEAVWRLGAWYVPTILFFWLAMMAIISTYRLDRAGHEENLRKLAARKSA